MPDFAQSLSDGLQEMGFEFTKEQEDQCQKYYQLLMEWNSKINLTAITEPVEVAIKHFVDSAICLKYINLKNNDSLIDVGTGAGFPGLPIKIFVPNIKLTLLDSLRKRCDFLEKTTEILSLANVAVIHGRAEDLGQNIKFRERFNWVTARGVTNLSVLAEYCLPFLKIGGCFFALKGPEVLAEMEKGKRSINLMGGLVKDIKSYQLPLLEDARTLVLVEKVKSTPPKYPRKAGTPLKQPIY